METDFEYYYNIVPGKGAVRNNLIYTSLISKDKKVFCQWYHNDTAYHQGKNQVVDPKHMDEKWEREVKFLTLMAKEKPDLVPKILDIDSTQRKIFLEIDGVDFWQQHYDKNCSYDDVVPDWREQILNIITAHKDLGFYKYSLHPSSYFIVDGKLKSINYFFCYFKEEPALDFEKIRSHISLERIAIATPLLEKYKVDLTQPLDLAMFQQFTFDSFGTNYPQEFVTDCKKIYK